MNKIILWTALVAGGLGASGGYWLALRHANGVVPVERSTPPEHASGKQERKILYYRNPMGLADTSPVPKKDSMGMDYIPVYEEDAESTPSETPKAVPSARPERKILYYRNPMGLPDTSQVPKKDSMGMDYIPVYEEEEAPEGANVLRVSVEKIQRLGVKTAPVETTDIARTVRSVGIVEADERRLYTVTLRFDGFIEKLHVSATGQAVTRGQPLFELYSPDLVSAQREYLTARGTEAALSRGEPWLQSGMKNLTDSSLERLRNWGISDTELASLEKSGKVLHALTVRSPAAGTVLEKSAVAGARILAGETLFRIADLSQVWIIAEVYEQDIGLIQPGQTVRASLEAYPGRSFQGKVGFIYPTLNPSTRTVRVRVELPNPEGLLKPLMYAQLEIGTGTHRALAVPRSAVLESGRCTLVLVERGEGRYEPRPVKPGIRGEELIEILEGLHEQERVVVSANFLIDAESNLKAAVGSFGNADSGAGSDMSTESPMPPSDKHSDQGGR
jgi:Cu(I)/Ag(I) efflux system membrane fusion protein